jgi:hypothetical protein
MTRRVKVACATITPPGSEVWKGQRATRLRPVKGGKRRVACYFAAPFLPARLRLGQLRNLLVE